MFCEVGTFKMFLIVLTVVLFDVSGSVKPCEPSHGCIGRSESLLVVSGCEASHGFFCLTLSLISSSLGCHIDI